MELMITCEEAMNRILSNSWSATEEDEYGFLEFHLELHCAGVVVEARPAHLVLSTVGNIKLVLFSDNARKNWQEIYPDWEYEYTEFEIRKVTFK